MVLEGSTPIVEHHELRQSTERIIYQTNHSPTYIQRHIRRYSPFRPARITCCLCIRNIPTSVSSRNYHFKLIIQRLAGAPPWCCAVLGGRLNPRSSYLCTADNDRRCSSVIRDWEMKEVQG